MIPLTQTVARALTEAFNTDVVACEVLKPFQGQVFCVDLTKVATVNILILSTGALVAPYDGPIAPALTLRGTIEDFANSVEDAPTEGLALEGSAALGKALLSAFELLSIDWVEVLSPILGPDRAEQLVPHINFKGLANCTRRWVKDSPFVLNLLHRWLT